MAYRTGVLCCHCNTSLVGIYRFLMSGNERINDFAYCPDCREVFRVKLEKV
jgi:hypothetical protein